MSVTRASLVALIIAWAPIFVNADTPALTKKQPGSSAPKSRRITYSQLIKTLERLGEKSVTLPNLAPQLDLEPGLPINNFVLDSLSPPTADKQSKSCHLVRDADGKPRYFLFRKANRQGLDASATYFRTDLSGKLLRATRISYKYDENDKIIKGTGSKLDLDASDPAVASDCTQETSFWLTEEYKRHLKPKTPATKP